MKRCALLLPLMLLLACENSDRESLLYGDEDSVPVVFAKVETVPVQSAANEDAADDPAIWYNAGNPAHSLVLGTDKKAGLNIYTLDGQLKQFIPSGLPNNVDLRQNVVVDNWSGDLAAASNRAGDVVTLFAINAQGGRVVGEFPAALVEPYGSCMALMNEQVLVFVTYKTGEIQAHQLLTISENKVEQKLLGTLRFASQLEGCVHDDRSGVLYVGEEGRGLWRTEVEFNNDELVFSPAQLVDSVDGNNGIAADIEGLGLYKTAEKTYVVASSQGNDSYAVYDHADQSFIGRFRIGNNATTGIDGGQETDGLEVDSRNFGEAFPSGLLVVQDGFNAPAGTAQNFKLVDWREVAKALSIE